jgi:hypothetical protein
MKTQNSDEVKERKLKGKVYLTFIIEKDGSKLTDLEFFANGIWNWRRSTTRSKTIPN